MPYVELKDEFVIAGIVDIDVPVAEKKRQVKDINDREVERTGVRGAVGKCEDEV